MDRATYENHVEARIRNHARNAANKVIMKGARWHPKSRSDAKRRQKWQCGLTPEESARADEIRSLLCPWYSKYALVRILMLEFIEAGESHIENHTEGCIFNDGLEE